MKKKLAVLLCLALLMTMFAVPAIAANPAPSVVIDNQTVTFDVPPMIDNGRTMVPLRAIFEQMGATVSWDDATQTARAVKGDITVVVTIGSASPTINGVVKTIDVPAKIVNSRTLAPMRFVCEAFGGVVSWDPVTYVASVATAGGTVTPPVIPTQMTLTLQQAVDLAVQNNPQVKLAEIDRNKKSIEYSQAKSTSHKIDKASTYAANLAEYLAPKIAERQSLQAQQVYEITINGMKIQAESAFYELIKARENQQIAENALTRADEQLRIANSKFSVGTVAKIEVIQNEAAQTGARAALTAAQNNSQQKMLELNKVIGVDMKTVVNPSGIFEFKAENYDFQPALDKASQEAMSVIKAQNNYDIAQWSYDFVVAYYGSGNWDAQKGKQDMDAAAILLKQAQDTIITAVNQTYSGYTATAEQYNYLLKAVELSKETYRLQQLSYGVGMTTFEDVQKASDSLTKAEAALSECIYSYNIIKSSLKYNIYA
jgi:outer membrane protein TolC